MGQTINKHQSNYSMMWLSLLCMTTVVALQVAVQKVHTGTGCIGAPIYGVVSVDLQQQACSPGCSSTGTGGSVQTTCNVTVNSVEEARALNHGAGFNTLLFFSSSTNSSATACSTLASFSSAYSVPSTCAVTSSTSSIRMTCDTQQFYFESYSSDNSCSSTSGGGISGVPGECHYTGLGGGGTPAPGGGYLYEFQMGICSSSSAAITSVSIMFAATSLLAVLLLF